MTNNILTNHKNGKKINNKIKTITFFVDVVVVVVLFGFVFI